MASTHTNFSCPEIPLQHEAIKSPAQSTGEDYTTYKDYVNACLSENFIKIG